MMYFKCILNLINFTRCWKSDSTRTLFTVLARPSNLIISLNMFDLSKVQTKTASSKLYIPRTFSATCFSTVNYVVRILIDFNYLFLVEVRATDWRHLYFECNIMNLQFIWWSQILLRNKFNLWNIWIKFFI
jgi:hypothetical protein